MFAGGIPFTTDTDALSSEPLPLRLRSRPRGRHRTPSQRSRTTCRASAQENARFDPLTFYRHAAFFAKESLAKKELIGRRSQRAPERVWPASQRQRGCGDRSFGLCACTAHEGLHQRRRPAPPTAVPSKPPDRNWRRRVDINLHLLISPCHGVSSAGQSATALERRVRMAGMCAREATRSGADPSFHRGSQYCSIDYQAVLKKRGLADLDEWKGQLLRQRCRRTFFTRPDQVLGHLAVLRLRQTRGQDRERAWPRWFYNGRATSRQLRNARLPRARWKAT